jgi:hypothetical protein
MKEADQAAVETVVVVPVVVVAIAAAVQAVAVDTAAAEVPVVAADITAMHQRAVTRIQSLLKIQELYFFSRVLYSSDEIYLHLN